MSAVDEPGRSLRPETLAVRGGLSRTGFDETSEALFLTSGFVYESAEQAEAAFKDEVEKFIYSRYGNPTVAMFEERLRLLEGAQACFATSSGMSAVWVALAALAGQGDRVVASRALSGPASSSSTDPPALRGGDGLRRRSGPGAVGGGAVRANRSRVLRDPEQPDAGARRHRGRVPLAHAAGAVVVVDNVFGTPVFSRPLEHGADVVVYSATKHIDGRDASSGARSSVRRVHRRSREEPHATHRSVDVTLQRLGPPQGSRDDVAARAPDGDNALTSPDLAGGTASSGSSTHAREPPAARARPAADGRWRDGRDLRVEGGKDVAFRLINALRLVDISNNLGDAKSIVTHPATRTHRRLTAEERAAVGITDGTVRISVGLESVEDLVETSRPHWPGPVSLTC